MSDAILTRFHGSDKGSLGVLIGVGRANGPLPLCYVLEDPYREKKVFGETRVPAGRYKLKLRDYGRFHEKYRDLFGPALHQGMLELVGVPGFTDILIHAGNTAEDTKGCLLTGEAAGISSVGAVGVQNSRAAYMKVYPGMAAAVKAGELYLTIRDADR